MSTSAMSTPITISFPMNRAKQILLVTRKHQVPKDHMKGKAQLYSTQKPQLLSRNGKENIFLFLLAFLVFSSLRKNNKYKHIASYGKYYSTLVA